MKMEHLLLKSKRSIFHNIFKSFQNCSKVLENEFIFLCELSTMLSKIENDVMIQKWLMEKRVKFNIFYRIIVLAYVLLFHPCYECVYECLFWGSTSHTTICQSNHKDHVYR